VAFCFKTWIARKNVSQGLKKHPEALPNQEIEKTNPW